MQHCMVSEESGVYCLVFLLFIIYTMSHQSNRSKVVFTSSVALQVAEVA